jgi:serine/threonine protein kinase/tetratricopeptide (TPR) repeat protein
MAEHLHLLIVANADQIIELLHEAKARPSGAERERFLDEACGNDSALKEQIVSLLKADADEGKSDFLKNTLLLRPSAPVTEKPGDRIGRYKLLEQIGEGGCGVVYMAEQQEPVRRRVALKVIKLGMDTKQVIARFEAERQALALMDHPNIAKVLDGGSTDTGRPFFVMELVRGIRITDYCDQNNLSTNERLELFIQVCQAIQHAHQKGIIHRDIKPSNILVTQNDHVAVPKVIDFGIAKATIGHLTDKTLFTAFAQFMGTPAYMSPEQAQMSGLDIDTRADIYSLGVLLYELLTGNTPFDAKALLAAGMDEMCRKIREDEPSRPSICLSTMLAMDLTIVAKHRHAEPPRLIHLLRGDLDWLVMKCLEKDRTRRYETANALAMDLQRHLNDEPVVACPPSRSYRFQKLVRRNKLAFAAASAVTAALVLGLGISTWMFFKEKRARQRAVTAEQDQVRLRRQAEAEAAKSEQVNQFLQDTLRNIASMTLRDRPILHNILDTTAARIGTELKLQPEVEAKLSWVIGNTYYELGDFTDAERMHRQAMANYQQLLGSENPTVATLLCNITEELSLQGKQDQAESLSREVLAMWKKLKGDEDPYVAESLDRLAMVLLRQSQPAPEPAKQKLLAEAETLERQALRLRRKLFGDAGTNVDLAPDDLAVILSAQGRKEEAATLFRESLALYRKQLPSEDRYVANTMIKLGNTLSDAGKHEEADPLVREGLAMHRRRVGNEHPDVALALSHHATLLLRWGKLAEAEIAEREALAIYSKLRTHPYLTVTLGQLVRALRAQGKLAEAETFQREKLAEERKLSGDDHELVANSLAELTSILLAEKKFEEAERPARECLALCETNLPNDWLTFNARSMLGNSLLGQKKYGEAELSLLSGYEGMKQREDKIPAGSKWYLKETLQRLVQLCEATGQSEKAAEWNKKLAEFDKAETEKKAAASKP